MKLLDSVKGNVEMEVEIAEELDDIHTLLFRRDQQEKEKKGMRMNQELVIDSKTAFYYLN